MVKLLQRLNFNVMGKDQGNHRGYLAQTGETGSCCIAVNLGSMSQSGMGP